MKLSKPYSRSVVALIVLAAVMLGAMPAMAQVTSGVQSVPLQYAIGESITLTATGTANPLILPTTQPGSPNVNINLAWVLNPSSRTLIGVLAYFASSTSALTSGSNSIPSSAVSTSVLGPAGGQTGPCTNAAATGPLAGVGVPGSNCTSFSLALSSSGYTSTGSTANNYEVWLNSAPTGYGTYNGTLLFVAQAI